MDFVIEYSLIEYLCRCSKLLSSKEAFLGMVCKNGTLHVFAYDHKAVVEFYLDLDESVNFEVGVNLEKFVAVSKRLYSDAAISFSVKANKFHMRQGNMKAQFPILRNVEKPADWAPMESVEADKSKWLVDSLICCNSSVTSSDKFQGVLIDQTERFARVSKLSGVSITIITEGGRLLRSDGRYVVPSEIISTMQLLQDKIRVVMLGDNWINFVFGNGVILRSCLLADNFPSDYIQSLGLLPGEQIIDMNQYNQYIFNRDEIYSAIDAVMIVSDNKKSPVHIEMVGFEEGSGLLVWRASCKSHDNSVLEETFKCPVQVQDPSMASFSVSGFDFINTLKTREELVYLYDSEEKSAVVISDLKGNKITMLIKSISK